MALVPSAVFNLLEGDPNYRKIVAQISSVPPLVGVSYNVYFRVDGPVAPLRLPNFTTPDGTLTPLVSLQTMPLVNLPLDSNGNTLEGTYTLKYFVENTAIPGIYNEIISTINLNVLKEGTLASCKIVPKLSIDVDCFCYKLTATDNTVYSLAGYDVTLTSRTLTVIIPTIPGQPATIPVTTTDASVTIGFDYSNVTYIVNLEAEYEHENADGTIVVLENIIATYSQKIKCDFNLCALVECLAKTMAALESKAARVGGWPNLPVYERDTVYQIQQLITLLELYRNCGNYTKVYDIYQKLVALIGCDCGCSEGKGDQPIAVSPSCGGSGAVSSIIGIYPIVVNQAGLTATISLDPSFLALINSYTAGNGLTVDTSGPTNEIILGGQLTLDTTITGTGVAGVDLTIDNIRQFELSGQNVGITSTNGDIVLDGLNDVIIQTNNGGISIDGPGEIVIESTNSDINIATPNKIILQAKDEIFIDAFNDLTLKSTDEVIIDAATKITQQSPDGLLSFNNLDIEVATALNIKSDTGFNIRTPNVIAATAKAGDVLKLINPANGACDYGPISNVIYFDDNPTSIVYTDDGAGVRPVLNFNVELENDGDYIEVDALLTVQGTTGDNPAFSIGNFPVFQHTANESYKQTLKGKIFRTSSSTFYSVFTSEIFDSSSGVFITSENANNSGFLTWVITQTLYLNFNLGTGDHQSSWKHFVVTKFKK